MQTSTGPRTPRWNRRRRRGAVRGRSGRDARPSTQGRLLRIAIRWIRAGAVTRPRCAHPALEKNADGRPLAGSSRSTQGLRPPPRPARFATGDRGASLPPGRGWRGRNAGWPQSRRPDANRTAGGRMPEILGSEPAAGGRRHPRFSGRGMMAAGEVDAWPGTSSTRSRSVERVPAPESRITGEMAEFRRHPRETRRAEGRIG